jgi:mRNA-degrading endonuclease toxin of MazEF toxin-antitoxin module
MVAAVPRRGEIWWVTQPRTSAQSGDTNKPRRPYVVVSSDSFNLVPEYPRVTVCPLTGAEHVPRRYDTDVFLSRRVTGLSKDSVVRCVEVYTVFRDRLVGRAANLPGSKMKEVDVALALYLALPAT